MPCLPALGGGGGGGEEEQAILEIFLQILGDISLQCIGKEADCIAFELINE